MNVRPTRLLDRPQLVAHVLAQLEVQRRQRLVQQQDLRLDRERPGDRDPLLLAAGQLVDPLGALVAQRHQVQQAFGPFCRRSEAATPRTRKP